MKLDDNGNAEGKITITDPAEPNNLSIAKPKDPVPVSKPDAVLKVTPPDESKIEENGSKSPKPVEVKAPILTVPSVKSPAVAEDVKSPMEVDPPESKEKEPSTTPAVSVPSPETKATTN